MDAYYKMFEVYFDSFIGERLPPHYNQPANFRAVAEKLRPVPNSVQYHTVNSMIKFGDWKFDEAIVREAALAIKLDPKFLRRM